MAATLSVNIITKDQPKATARAVASLKSLLCVGDEIIVVDTGSRDETLAELKRLLPEVVDEGVDLQILERPDLSVPLQPYIDQWLPERAGEIEQNEQYKNLRGLLDFAAARNVALDASTKDLVFWIDSDDVLIEKEPGQLRRVLNEHLADPNPTYSALFLTYEYAFTEDGVPSTILKRERAVRRGEFRWKGRCHETLIPEDHCKLPVGFGADLYSVIRHTEARKTGVICDIRNYLALRKEVEESRDTGLDPRTQMYIGNAARGLQRWREALDYYRAFFYRSGSPDDRYATCHYICDILMRAEIQRPVEAAKWYREATAIFPKDPRAYFGLSRCYAAQMRWSECIDWFEIARGFEPPEHTLHTYDPNSVFYTPLIIAAKAYLELQNPAKAVECVQAAKAFRPNAPDIDTMVHLVEQTAAGHRLTDMLIDVGRHVKGGPGRAREMLRKILPYLYAVPEALEKVGIGLSQEDPRDEAPSIAIVCGDTAEQWGPESALTGIGGSEKMILLLAPALQRLGWNVTVYASVPHRQRGVYPDGVRWAHWSEFDNKTPVDVLVGWRFHGHMLMPVSAGLRVLWLHDVQNPEQYTPEILAATDLVITESEYHAAPIRDVVPAEKLVVLRNAVAPPEIDLFVDKDPKRVIFLQSPDRGLVTALKMVSLAQQEDPEIKVTVLYGFSPYARKCRAMRDHQQILDLGRDGSLDEYELEIGGWLDLTNADQGNRVGFDQVWEHLRRAGIWLYPTRFPEISCMSAMEAQLAGCVCITSEYAALAETLLPEAKALGENLGPVEDSAEYIERGARAILAATQIPADDPRRATQSEAAELAYNVKHLAEDWDRLFRAGEPGSGGSDGSESGSVRPARVSSVEG